MTRDDAKVDVRVGEAAARDLVPNALVWHIDPTEYALGVADSRRTSDRTTMPKPLCTEVGRRLLRLQFRFSRWVLRRVEKVEFDHDRQVFRRTTIELRVPDDAPRLWWVRSTTGSSRCR